MSGRIERVLADCLDRIDRGEATVEEAMQAHPEMTPELGPLLRLADELRSIPRVRAPESLRTTSRPAFVDRKAAPVDLSAGRAGFGAQRLSGRMAPLVRLAAGLAAAFLLLSGTMAASAGSLPEEPLYPVKLAVESVQLALAPRPEVRAELQLQFASNRLEEVESAALQGKTEAVQKGLALYAERVEGALQAAPDIGEEESARRLQSSLEHQQEVLNRVYHQVPPQAQPAILQALQISGGDRSSREGPKAEPESRARPAAAVGSTSAGKSGDPRADTPATAVQAVDPASTAGSSTLPSGPLPRDQEGGEDHGNSEAARQGSEDRNEGRTEGQEKPGRDREPDTEDPAQRTGGPTSSTTVPPTKATVVPDSTTPEERGRDKGEKAGDWEVPSLDQSPQALRGHERDRSGDNETTQPSPTPTGVVQTGANPSSPPASADRGRRDDSARGTGPAGSDSSPKPGKVERDKDAQNPKSSSEPSYFDRAAGPLNAAINFLTSILGRNRR